MKNADESRHFFCHSILEITDQSEITRPRYPPLLESRLLKNKVFALELIKDRS